MWFRHRRFLTDTKARHGVAGPLRRSSRFGPRTIETLEDRALMSHGGHPLMPHADHPSSHQHTRFVQTNLVSDGAVPSSVVDPKLVNPWGLAASSKGPLWVSDNGSGSSTLYNGSGAKLGLEVTIPPPAGSSSGTTAAPTGIVFNGNASEFLVGPNAPAAFIFSTEDGTISGWNPGVDLTHAVLAADNSTQVYPNGSTGAVYKALALANNGGADFLYATNFRSGKVDVFDSSFHQVTLAAGAFTDRHIPASYAPFGIASITPPGASQSYLVVTYAQQNAAKHDDVAGKGHGFVDVFDTSGHLLNHVAARGALNSPWGIALAPSHFGSYGGDLLIGNFGDGRINAFKLPKGRSHHFESAGPLKNANGKPVVIDGLWSLAFGNGASAGPTDTVFFTAGINGEADGLFGTLTIASM
jgi:uncharacterized protein (TIGR03118 family)